MFAKATVIIMFKRFYDKSDLLFALAWILAYCVLMSSGDYISFKIGIEKSATLPIGILLCVILLVFLKKNGLLEKYGLCRGKVSYRSMLYYIPVFIMLTANLWYGVKLNLGVLETLLYIFSMFCVGFLEEIIFRGLLFGAMCKDNLKAAVIVSSLTFGMGHIINLINGSGAELLPNLLQVVYASTAGFMFVMIYCKTKSLLWCIASHGIFNALSVFAYQSKISNSMQIFTATILTAITGAYGAYIAISIKKDTP